MGIEGRVSIIFDNGILETLSKSILRHLWGGYCQ